MGLIFLSMLLKQSPAPDNKYVEYTDLKSKPNVATFINEGISIHILKIAVSRIAL